MLSPGELERDILDGVILDIMSQLDTIRVALAALKPNDINDIKRRWIEKDIQVAFSLAELCDDAVKSLINHAENSGWVPITAQSVK